MRRVSARAEDGTEVLDVRDPVAVARLAGLDRTYLGRLLKQYGISKS